jgi:hypothetical protein
MGSLVFGEYSIQDGYLPVDMATCQVTRAAALWHRGPQMETAGTGLRAGNPGRMAGWSGSVPGNL